MRRALQMPQAVQVFVATLLLSTIAFAQTTKHKITPQSRVANVYLMQEGLVDANGVMIYYKSVGRGRPLVILHGGPGASHDYFLPNLYLLARHNRLVFIDERGSGRSPQLDDPKQYTVDNMVEDVEAVRQALGLGKISLLGHSFGGVLAQAYALKYQHNLSHLVLASTFASTQHMNDVLARIKGKLPADARQRAQDMESAGLFDKGKPWQRGRYPDAYAELAWGDGYFPYLYGARPDPNYDPRDGNTHNSWMLYREMWGSHGEFIIDGNLASVEYLDRLSTIKVPTLIIAGDHDECDPSLSREMHDRIAKSSLVILPDSGHMTFVDQPALFMKAVSDFVNREPAR